MKDISQSHQSLVDSTESTPAQPFIESSALDTIKSNEILHCIWDNKDSINLPQVAIIISCYNYERYIMQCLDSIITQDYPKSKYRIIVVDDGSTDNSVRVIKDFVKSKKIENLTLIAQSNKGQLGSFNAGFRALENEEIIFFMDADDMMNVGYISRCVEMYMNNPNVDMAFCNIIELSNGEKKQKISHKPCGILGFSVFSAYFLKEYFGHSTSCISIKHTLLSKILPLDLEAEWRIRADDCIIYGASLCGANVYHLDFYGITYRIHGMNNHYGKQFDSAYFFKRELYIEQLFATILERNHINFSSAMLYFEFLSNGNRLKYAKIVLMSDFVLLKKCILLLKILCKPKCLLRLSS